MRTAILSYNALRQNADFRFDPDYAVHPLTQGTKIYKARFMPLQDTLEYISSGHTPYLHDVSQGDVNFVTVECVGDLTLDETTLKHITKEQFAHEFKKNRVIRDSVLCTIKRRICKAYPFLEAPFAPMAMNQDVALLIPNQSIDSAYLATYLCCKVGQSFADRQKTEQMNPYISVANLCRLPIAVLSGDFQKSIRNIFEHSLYINQQSIDAYKTAERILLSELGLLNWKPRRCLSFVKKFSDTNSAGRIDAEYFQPMYDDILEVVRKYRYGFESTGILFKQNRSGFKNAPDELYSYVEISSVNTSSGEMEPLSLMGKELPANAKIKLNNGDLIISKVRTYRGAIAIVQRDGLVGSGAFTVLRELGKINKETAYVYFKSAPLLKLSLKYNAGTSYPVIDDKDILNLPFPLMPDKTQQDIKQKITEMYEAKALSKRLLDIAKRGVEMAIEKNEKVAQNWIDAELKKLNISLD
jgi:hypothetical protein